MSLFTKIFGTSSQREVKAITPLVDKIESLEEEYKALTDQQLQAKTAEFKAAPAERRDRWTTSCPRPLPPAGRRPGGCWACAPTGSSSSAASCSTRAASPR